MLKRLLKINNSPLNMEKLLIIGGTGSLGQMLVKTFATRFRIYVVSRGENALWKLKCKYSDVECIVGDISDKDRIKKVISTVNPEYIILAAALKHIDICESNTYESIKTNIVGIQNVVFAIEEINSPNLRCVLHVSTDKACSPVSVYGMTKAIGERVIIEASTNPTIKHRYVVVRYGNVLNSSGSLLPKFHEIGKDPSKQAFTVTNKNMTRFFMSLMYSVRLILFALLEGKNGCTYVPKLESYRIDDIAQVFSEVYNKPITYMGSRPGEKLHEELLNSVEIARTFLSGVNGEYYEVYPLVKNPSVHLPMNVQPVFLPEYSSETSACSDRDKIKQLIIASNQ